MATAEQDVAELSLDPRRANAGGVSLDWGNDRMPVPSVPRGGEPDPATAGSSTTAAPAAESVTTATAPRPSRRWGTGRWMWILGMVGFAVGGCAAAIYARRMGYDWPLAGQIGGLVGMTTAAVGAMLPPLARAIWWTALAALCGATGGLAVWLLTRVAPAFVDRFTP